jgi:protein-L-isoaspartate O-methyltransferase
VPRDLFIKAMGGGDILNDGTIITRWDRQGLPISSSTAPRIMIAMLNELDLHNGHKVLEVGTGTGYNTAILSMLVGPCGHVTSLEADRNIALRAFEVIRNLGLLNIEIIPISVYKWVQDSGQYDRIIVTCDLSSIPDALISALKPGGRLVLPSCFLYSIDKCVDGSVEGIPFSNSSFMAARYAPTTSYVWKVLKDWNGDRNQLSFVYACKNTSDTLIRQVMKRSVIIDDQIIGLKMKDFKSFHHFVWASGLPGYVKVQNICLGTSLPMNGFGIINGLTQTASLMLVQHKSDSAEDYIFEARFGGIMGHEWAHIYASWRQANSPDISKQKVELVFDELSSTWRVLLQQDILS